MTSVAQQLPVSLTPVRSAGYTGAHRAATAPLTRRIRPWVHRGLAVGTLTAGLWLAGSLSQAPAAEAAPSGAPQRPAVSTTSDASVRPDAAGAGSVTAPAGRHSSRPSAATQAVQISPISQRKTGSTGSAAAGAAGGLGTLSKARSDASGATPAPGSGAARRSVSTVVKVAAEVTRSASAVPLPAAPVLRTPAPAISVLPAVSVPGPAAVVPTVIAPALPVLPARPVKPAQVLPSAQQAAEATGLPAPAATAGNQGGLSGPSSDVASIDKPAGQHPSQRPVGETAAGPALPQQPSTPPVGHRPGTVPGPGLSGGHHPLDSGLAPTDLSSLGNTPAGDCRGRDHTPPRERATAPSTSPD